ncbi:MAG: hypothetical protein QXW79_05320 [Thermoplasmata archaeon]
MQEENIVKINKLLCENFLEKIQAIHTCFQQLKEHVETLKVEIEAFENLLEDADFLDFIFELDTTQKPVANPILSSKKNKNGLGTRIKERLNKALKIDNKPADDLPFS